VSHDKCHTSQSHHIIGSYDEYRKIVYRLCNTCISSIQELNENSIKFFLSTQIRSRIECLLLMGM